MSRSRKRYLKFFFHVHQRISNIESFRFFAYSMQEHYVKLLIDSTIEVIEIFAVFLNLGTMLAPQLSIFT